MVPGFWAILVLVACAQTTVNLDRDNRLEIRAVKIRFVQGGAVAIAEGLGAGETLAVSDLVPAAAGMLLEPVTDEKAMKRLKMEATGQKGHKP